MRSANAVESAISEPPKPRLMTGLPGKSFASVCHFRMLELPTNRIACFGGGFLLSLASNALISGSHLDAFAFVCARSSIKPGAAGNSIINQQTARLCIRINLLDSESMGGPAGGSMQ